MNKIKEFYTILRSNAPLIFEGWYISTVCKSLNNVKRFCVTVKLFSINRKTKQRYENCQS